MSENQQEQLIIALGIIITIIPILRELYSKIKSLKSYAYLFLIITPLILYWVLSSIKPNRDKASADKNEEKIDSLLKQTGALVVQVNLISHQKNSDSLIFKQFENNLKDEFKIIRDSLTNKPIKVKIFNTIIQNAKDVNIGQD